MFAVDTAISSCTKELISQKDFRGAAVSLVRLMRSYDLDVEDVLAGNIKGFQAQQPLGPEDIRYLAFTAQTMQETGYAAQLLKHVVEHDPERAERQSAAANLAILYARVSPRASQVW